MHKAKFGKLEKEIPSHWNELKGGQLLLMSRLLLNSTDLEDIKVKLLFAFTGIKVMRRDAEYLNGTEYFWLKDIVTKSEFLVDAFSLAYVSKPFLNFFTHNEDKNQYHLNPQLTRNLIPTVCAKKHVFYGPSDGLANLTFNEFISTEAYYSEYINGDTSALDKLIAVLYRPGNGIEIGSPNFKGDTRIPFNDFNVDYYAEKVSTLLEYYKRAILWYYEGSKQHLYSLFPYMFKKGDGSSSRRQENVFRVFMNIVDDLADHRPADKDRIRNTMLYDVLDSMNRKIQLLPEKE